VAAVPKVPPHKLKKKKNRVYAGARGSVVVKALCYKPHYGPGVDSASNRNEYQESLKIKKPGGKVQAARRADNLAAIY
jgi:hypothetical protein